MKRIPPSKIHERLLETRNLRYAMAFPAGYTGDQPVPLVLALHFGGKVTPYYGKLFLTGLVEPGLRELGALIVAPDCSARDWIQPESETDVLALLDHMLTTYNIDSQRILVTGYSMGGIGTWYLAAHHPNRFAAALVMSGSPPPSVVDVEWQLPLYVIHSRQDEVLPFEETEAVVHRMKTRGAPVELVAVGGITHYETNRFIAPLRAAVPWIQKAWHER